MNHVQLGPITCIKPDYPQIISVEGLDGTGKTTLTFKIEHYLQSLGYRAGIVRQNKDTVFGEWMRKLIQSKDADSISDNAFTFLFAAGFIDTIENKFMPILTDNGIVISDRFTLSTRVYQDKSIFSKEVCDIIENHLKPDVVFLLDTDLSVLQKRIEKRGEATDKFETVDIEELAVRRTLYMTHAFNKEESTVIVVDASGNEDDVWYIVKQHLDKLYR